MLRSLLFLLVLVANIVSAELGFEFGVYLSKPLLIPILAWGLLGTRMKDVKWVWIALFFSWIGDILLMLPFDLFVFGLASFLLAHVFYILHFSGLWDRVKKTFQPLYLLGVLIYLGALLYWLFPIQDNLEVPVILYGLVISTMLLFALHTDRSGYRWGALLFVLSDSILAIHKFHTPLLLSGLWVMATYGGAQFLFVKTTADREV